MSLRELEETVKRERRVDPKSSLDRLNKKLYDAQHFTERGMDHIESESCLLGLTLSSSAPRRLTSLSRLEQCTLTMALTHRWR